MKRLLLACACLWLAACTPSISTSLADRLVAPGGTSPLLDTTRLEATVAELPHREGTVTVQAGIPIAWRAYDPGDYGLQYHYTGRRGGDSALPGIDLQLQPASPFLPRSPRGTVVLLHGWMMNGDSLLPWSLHLAQAGYRTISIDLRSHGHSGNAPAGYGTHESQDVAEVIQALRADGEIQGPLYLLGVSYGAATALFTAQQPGTGVSAVVAMEPFANAGAAIRSMVPHLLAMQPASWRERAVADYARWRYAQQDLEQAIATADQRLGLQLDKVNVAAATTTSPVCILLLHGDHDQHIPVSQAHQLARSNPRLQYIEIRGEDHISLPMRLDLLGGVVEDWLADRSAPAGLCAAPRLPVQANLMALAPQR